MAKGWQIDDQLMLNTLIYRGQHPVRPTAEDPAVTWAFNNTLRTVFLPALLCAAHSHHPLLTCPAPARFRSALRSFSSQARNFRSCGDCELFSTGILTRGLKRKAVNPLSIRKMRCLSSVRCADVAGVGAAIDCARKQGRND